MRLSVITPTYNRADCIEACVESVASQLVDVDDVEHIIVDDGSQDNTPALIKSYAQTYPHVKAICYKQNRGVNYARNRGIECATGHFIIFLDSDDFLTAGALKKIHAAIKENPSYFYFLFRISYGVWKGTTTAEFTFDDYLLEKVHGDFLHVVQSGILKKYKFFEEFRAFEHLNWLRIIREAQPVLYTPALAASACARNTNDSLSREVYKTSDKKKLSQNFAAKRFDMKLYGTEIRVRSRKIYYKRVLLLYLLGLRADLHAENATLVRDCISIAFARRMLLLFNNKLSSSCVRKLYTIKYAVE